MAKGEKAAKGEKKARGPIQRVEGPRQAVRLHGGEDGGERLSFSVGPLRKGGFALRTRKKTAEGTRMVAETFDTFDNAVARQSALVSAATEKGWAARSGKTSAEDLL